MLKRKLDRNTAIIFEDGSTLQSGPHPFYLRIRGGKQRHNVYDSHGRWIGDDLTGIEDPYRVVTQGAQNVLPGLAVVDLFVRYDAGDYGEGEAGFATYSVNGQDVWLIDDAVRTPEGEPPARDPKTSPGPQTLLLPSEY
jgi:hypothetical protein